MKIKNIKLYSLILAGLVILSYGFLISAQEGFNSTANVLTSSTTEPGDNMTKQVAQKLSTFAKSTDPEYQNISVDQLQKIINDSISPSLSANELPVIDPAEIKIKKQDYKGTKEQIKDKKKEDFTNYIVAVYYIMASSSPKPLTNNDDLNSLESYIIQAVTDSLTSRDSSGLSDLAQSGQKILDQLKDVTVPEDVLDIHIKALEFAQYAITLKPAINANTDDPLADLVNISKMQGFAETLMGFSSEVNTKLREYDLAYDDILKGKINSLGITAPEIDPEKLVPEADDTETSDTD